MTRSCVLCDAPFSGRADKVYCSKKCKNAHWRHRFPDRAKAGQVAWRTNNPEASKQSTLRWQARNIEHYRAKQKRYYDENREKIYLKNKKWTERNRARVNARCMARHAAKMSATPKWLTLAQRQEITRMYERAQELTQSTGINHEVDHVIPLISKAVCGLHVPWNLRVITARENRAKQNRIAA